MSPNKANICPTMFVRQRIKCKLYIDNYYLMKR